MSPVGVSSERRTSSGSGVTVGSGVRAAADSLTGGGVGSRTGVGVGVGDSSRDSSSAVGITTTAAVDIGSGPTVRAAVGDGEASERTPLLRSPPAAPDGAPHPSSNSATVTKAPNVRIDATVGAPASVTSARARFGVHSGHLNETACSGDIISGHANEVM